MNPVKWDIEETTDIWLMVDNEAENLSRSDKNFMLSIGYILGILDNPNRTRKPKSLDIVDRKRLKRLITNVPL